MQASLQSILIQILTIINYPKEKEAFVIEFGDMCISKTLAIVAEPLIENKREELVNKIKDIADPNEALAIIGQYIAIDTYQKTLEQTTQNLFEDFLNTIEPDLTEEQSKTLDDYFASFEKKPDKPQQS
jgi:hypothetical protein